MMISVSVLVLHAYLKFHGASHEAKIRRLTCCSGRTHYYDSESTSMCTYSLLPRIYQRSNKQQFYYVWYDPTYNPNQIYTYTTLKLKQTSLNNLPTLKINTLTTSNRNKQNSCKQSRFARHVDEGAHSICFVYFTHCYAECYFPFKTFRNVPKVVIELT